MQVFQKIQDTILQLVFPGLVQLSIVMSSSLFVVTSVQDREEKLRYLLNFSGISSFAYFTGLFLADIILFMIPCFLVMAVSYVLNIESFYRNFRDIILALFVFGLGFMQLNYLVGFIFQRAETAFKYQLLAMMIFYSLRMTLHVLDVTLMQVFVSKKQYHYNQIEQFSLAISSFECLGELIRQALDRGIGKYRLKASKNTIYLYCLCQALVYFYITIVLDRAYCNRFKGK
jgi:hypothetical protein